MRMPGLRALIGLAVAVLLVAGGWLWLRDSPLVSVDHVKVTGLHGPDAARIRSALTMTASDMTTLDIDAGTLRSVVEPFSGVAAISIHAHPPHSLTIAVRMNVAVAAATHNGQSVAIAADGTLLSGVDTLHVPVIEVSVPPAGRRLADPAALAKVALAAAAPEPLRGRLVDIWHGSRGLGARLRDGPDLYFGTTQRLAAKWAAVSRVLADPASAGATYLDVTVPERVGAGGLEPTTALNP
jgi:cell division protein FtsQ